MYMYNIQLQVVRERRQRARHSTDALQPVTHRSMCVCVSVCVCVYVSFHLTPDTGECIKRLPRPPQKNTPNSCQRKNNL